MKLIILKNNLVEAFSVMERAVGSNVNLPILKHILFRTKENKIICTSTNLELAIERTISGKIMEEGEMTVPFGILHTIVKNLNTERIVLEKKEKNLFISTENYEATIQGQEAQEFPIIPSIHNAHESLHIEIETLKEALENVIVATQYSEIRPEISGVFFHYENNQLTLAATDSFRLAEYIIQSKELTSSFEKTSFILPLKTAEEILKIFSLEKGNVELFLDQNQILFVTNASRITSRLIDGTFPEYRAIIPKQVKGEVTMNREEIMSGIKLTSSFSGRAHDITLCVGENKKFLELVSIDPALGENKYRAPLKLKGDPFSVVFNWRYLLDGLKIYKGEEITLGVSAHGPALIKDLQNQALLYVLMPIKA